MCSIGRILRIGVEPAISDRDDIGMIDSGGGFGLQAEAALAVHVDNFSGRQNLQRDEPVQVNILRFVDLAHAALTELVEDTVVRNDAADHFRSSLRQPGEPGKRCRAASTPDHRGGPDLEDEEYLTSKPSTVDLDINLFVEMPAHARNQLLRRTTLRAPARAASNDVSSPDVLNCRI